MLSRAQKLLLSGTVCVAALAACAVPGSHAPAEVGAPAVAATKVAPEVVLGFATIKGAAVPPRTLAVLPFSGAADATVDPAPLVQADLLRTGQFQSVPDIGSTEAGSLDVLVGSGARYVVTGEISVSGVQVKLWDARESRVSFEQHWALETAKDPRPLAHRIANAIYAQLLSTRGVFDHRLAYVEMSPARDVWRLMRVDLDGGHATVLTESREPLMAPAASPDGRQLAFVGHRKGRSGIYVISVETGELRQLVAEEGVNGTPAWSPDSSRLAYTLSYGSNPDVYVQHLASGERLRITQNEAIDTEPVWSADGKTLVFTSDREGGQPQLYEIPSAGGTAKKLALPGKQNLRAAFSADGERTVWVTLDGPNRYRLSQRTLPRGEITAATEGPRDVSPSFAPDSRTLAYISGLDREHSALRIAWGNGGAVQELRSQWGVIEAAWLPAIAVPTSPLSSDSAKP